MDKAKVFTIASFAMSLAAALFSNIASDKKMKEAIEEEVAKQVKK